MNFQLPVRFASEPPARHAFTTLMLDPASMRLMIVDADGDCGPACNVVIDTHIAPTLTEARRAGI